jgi:hypothetical protein
VRPLNLGTIVGDVEFLAQGLKRRPQSGQAFLAGAGANVVSEEQERRHCVHDEVKGKSVRIVDLVRNQNSFTVVVEIDAGTLMYVLRMK